MVSYSSGGWSDFQIQQHESDQVRLRMRPVHECAESIAAGFGVPEEDVDELQRVVFDAGTWGLEKRGYYGFEIGITFCPFCGVKLEAQP